MTRVPRRLRPTLWQQPERFGNLLLALRPLERGFALPRPTLEVLTFAGVRDCIVNGVIQAVRLMKVSAPTLPDGLKLIPREPPD